MIICSCNVLSDQDVRSIVGAPDAPRTAAQVHRCLGCSPECGRCAPTNPPDRRRRGPARRRTTVNAMVGMTPPVRPDRMEAHVLAERNVPRYTSYPTAPHFSPHRTRSLCVLARRAAGGDAAVALPARPVLRANSASIAAVTPRRCASATRSTSTPTSWRRNRPGRRARFGGAACRTCIGAAARRRFSAAQHLPRSSTSSRPISISPACTSTRSSSIRADVDRGSSAALARLGINRASLGVQDFAPHVQKAIGRVQPLEQVRGAVALLRDAGIARINIDLMYGLPHQTSPTCARSAELARRCARSRIALFGYAHVPWFKKYQRLIEGGAAGRGRTAGADAGGARDASRRGYVPIGLDHFALADDELAAASATRPAAPQFPGLHHRPGRRADRLRRLVDRPLPQGFVQNAPDRAAIPRAIEAGRFAVVQGHRAVARRPVRGGHHRAADVRSHGRPRRAIAAVFGVPAPISPPSSRASHRWSRAGMVRDRRTSHRRDRARSAVRAAGGRRIRRLSAPRRAAPFDRRLAADRGMSPPCLLMRGEPVSMCSL